MSLTKLPMRDYLQLEALSAGTLRTMLDKCPKAAWYESYLNPHPPSDNDSDDTDIGTIAHALFLEDDMSGIEVIDPNMYPAEKTGAIPTGWTNKAIRQARDRARLAGKIPVFAERMQEIHAMWSAAHSFIGGLCDAEPAIYEAFTTAGGDSELVGMWDDAGVPCRIRPDRISKDGRVVIHYKTTAGSVEPDAWGRMHLFGEGLYTWACFYRRGIKVILGVASEHVFLCQETKPPYLCSLIGLPPDVLEMGDAEVATAIDDWRRFAKSGEFPSYPSRACYPEAPPWVLAKMGVYE